MGDLALLVFGAALASDYVLARLLGLWPVLAPRQRVERAHALGLSAGGVLLLAAPLGWMAQHWLLAPFGLEFLRTPTQLLLIGALVQALDLALRVHRPLLHRQLGFFLPLVALNAALLALVLIDAPSHATLPGAIALGAGAALGYALVLALFAALQERLALADVPECFRGTPIALITAGVMMLAFLGFAGMVPG